MRRVLVARLDSVGDVLLAGPAVRAVAAGWDGERAEVFLLCGPQGAPWCEAFGITPQESAALGRAGRRRVRTHYSWDRVAGETARVYGDTGRPSGPATARPRLREVH